MGKITGKIDKSIKKIITILNNEGYGTAWSCSGHKGEKNHLQGYISFDKKLSDEDLQSAKDILHENGILRISYKMKNMQHGRVTVFYFAPKE